MLRYVPVVFELYLPLKANLRWTLMCLIRFAGRDGKCWPSVRTLAEVAGIGKSTVSRHLAELTRLGILSRTRKPGGVYVYQVDSRFLPAAAKVSHPQEAVSQPDAAAVPRGRTKEKFQEYTIKKRGDSALLDYGSQWQARVRSWKKDGFWLPAWGPRPNERGCLAPVR